MPTSENDLFALSFTVPGKPFGKQTSRSAPNGRHYTTDKTRFYEGLVTTIAMQAMHEAGYQDPYSGSLGLTLIAVFPVPTSWSIKKKAAALAGKVLPTVKPDLSNIQKAVEDGMNCIVYKDDSQIAWANTRKIYGEHPCVKVLVVAGLL